MNYSSVLAQAEQCLTKHDFAQAMQLYSQVIHIDPHNGPAYLGLGNIALKAEQYDKAVSLLTKSCELLPQEPNPLIQLSDAFNGVHSAQDGLTVLEYAVKQFPNNAFVQYKLALQQLTLGEIKQAKSSFLRVLELDQDVTRSYAIFELSRLGYQQKNFINILTNRLSSESISLDESITLHYALANILDSDKKFNKAWEHYSLANKFQRQKCQFNTSELVAFFCQINKNASQQNLAIRSHQSKPKDNSVPTPIFILGLPRTGSSLLEFFLSQHPDIASAGEVNYLSRNVDDYVSQHFGIRYPQSLANLSPKQLTQASRVYLDKLATHAQGKPYVIDKLPANFQSIGLIYKLFPNAKVLNITRNVQAVALSIFRNYFAQHEPYFCSLEEFKQYHGLYLDLMAHWQANCGDFIYQLSYEQLIANKEAVISGVLSFCGLANTIEKNINKTPRQPIATLSNVQVSGEINNKSVEHWHNYAEYLTMFENNKNSKHANQQ